MRTLIALIMVAALCLFSTSLSAAQGQSCVALTFDDGPHAVLTPRLLDMLDAERVKATFFVVGENVLAFPDIVRRAQAQGHDIENHSMHHPQKFPFLSSAAIKAEMDNGAAAIERVLKMKPRLMRTPGGAWTGRVREVLGGRTNILWTVDPEDWKPQNRNAGHVTRYVLSHVSKPVEIVLLHDIRKTTVDAVPAIIRGLKARGARFVTVSELQAGVCSGAHARIQ